MSKSQKNLQYGSIKNKSDAKLNDKYSIKKKTIFDRDRVEETKTTDTSLGAVIFWSGFHLFKKPYNEIYKTNTFPIFVYHGLYDKMIDWDYSIKPFMKLYKSKYDVEINSEEIGHTMSEREWRLIRNFIYRVYHKENINKKLIQ